VYNFGISLIVKTGWIMTNKSKVVVLIIGLIILSGLLLYGLLGHYIYFASLIGVFFIPSLLLWFYIDLHADRWEKTALAVVLIISFFFSVVIEIIGVYFKFWTFFTDKDPLLGINIGDIPIEEFLFYIGANMQLCFLYLAVSLKCDSIGITAKRVRSWFSIKKTDQENASGTKQKKAAIIIAAIIAVLAAVGLVIRAKKEHPEPKIPEKYRNSRGMPVYKEGVWYPGWLIAITPFFAVGVAWFRAMIKKINVAAFLISLVLNMTMYILFEYNAIMRGHWVYNEQRLLGLKFAGTMSIELFLVYITSFLFLVPFFETIRYFFICKLGTQDEKKVYEEEV
jgi:lycopene cyclase domain-containing protein